MSIREISFVWVGRATVAPQNAGVLGDPSVSLGNPKQNRLRRVTAFFCGGKVGLMGSGAQKSDYF